jgi:hypothetical protein
VCPRRVYDLGSHIHIRCAILPILNILPGNAQAGRNMERWKLGNNGPQISRACHHRLSPFNPSSHHSTLKSTRSMDYASVISGSALSFPMFGPCQPLGERHSAKWRSAFHKTEHDPVRASFLAPRFCLTRFHSDDWRLFARSFALLPLFFDLASFVFNSLQLLFAKRRGMPSAGLLGGYPGWGVSLP